MIAISTTVVFDNSKDDHDEIDWDKREKSDGSNQKG